VEQQWDVALRSWLDSAMQSVEKAVDTIYSASSTQMSCNNMFPESTAMLREQHWRLAALSHHWELIALGHEENSAELSPVRSDSVLHRFRKRDNDSKTLLTSKPNAAVKGCWTTNKVCHEEGVGISRKQSGLGKVDELPAGKMSQSSSDDNASAKSDDNNQPFVDVRHQPQEEPRKELGRSTKLIKSQTSRWFEDSVLKDGPSQPQGSFRLKHSFSTVRKHILGFIAGAAALARLYTLIFTPLIVSFTKSPAAVLSACEVSSEVAFIANVCAPFVFGARDEESNEWVESRRRILVLYAKNWLFVDLVSAFPWHCAWLVTRHSLQSMFFFYLSLLRLLQLPRLVSEFVFGDAQRNSPHVLTSLHPNLLRVMTLICFYFYMVHLVACGRNLVGFSASDAMSWVLTSSERDSVFAQWTSAYQWALCSILGENMQPSTYAETLYTSGTVALGVLLNSCVVGSITSLLGSLDERAAKQKSKLDAVNTFMQKNGVNQDVCEQVRQYYKYLHASVDSQFQLKLFDDLSQSLRLKIDLCIHKNFIKRCHIFTACSPECVVTLVNIISRKSMILVPQELVFKKGDVGNAMYFIMKGNVILYDPGSATDEASLDFVELCRLSGEEDACGSKMLTVAKGGQFFGELALIMDDNQRAASAAALSFVELLCLPRSDFMDVLEQYPTFSRQLCQYVQGRYSNHNSGCILDVNHEKRSSRTIKQFLAGEGSQGSYENSSPEVEPDINTEPASPEPPVPEPESAEPASPELGSPSNQHRLQLPGMTREAQFLA